jgi:hypothetical protein
MNVARSHLRQNLAQLFVSDQRFTADDRDVQRAMAIDQRHEPVNELVAFVVGQSAQRHLSAEMIVSVRIAAWTTKGTLLGDLDREIGTIAREDPAPGVDDLTCENRFRYVHCGRYYELFCLLMPRDPQFPRIIRRRSKVHGWGVFALEAIPKNKRIVTYDGELIDHKESLKRETQYLERGEIWCFTVNRRWVRDAHVGGNIARFINHACKPNCYSQIIGRDIWIRAGRNIEPGEELTYDYYTDGEKTIQCRCRPECTRRL